MFRPEVPQMLYKTDVRYLCTLKMNCSRYRLLSIVYVLHKRQTTLVKEAMFPSLYKTAAQTYNFEELPSAITNLVNYQL